MMSCCQRTGQKLHCITEQARRDHQPCWISSTDHPEADHRTYFAPRVIDSQWRKRTSGGAVHPSVRPIMSDQRAFPTNLTPTSTRSGEWFDVIAPNKKGSSRSDPMSLPSQYPRNDGASENMVMSVTLGSNLGPKESAISPKQHQLFSPHFGFDFILSPTSEKKLKSELMSKVLLLTRHLNQIKCWHVITKICNVHSTQKRTWQGVT